MTPGRSPAHTTPSPTHSIQLQPPCVACGHLTAYRRLAGAEDAFRHGGRQALPHARAARLPAPRVRDRLRLTPKPLNPNPNPNPNLTPTLTLTRCATAAKRAGPPSEGAAAEVGPGAELPVALSEFLGFEVRALRLSTRR
eukprot:scaffold110839_cov60-Phaeocystis_antarctica.AAC.3